MNFVNTNGTPVHLEPDLRIDTFTRDADGVRVHDDARHAESLDEMVEVSVSDRLQAGPIGGAAVAGTFARDAVEAAAGR